MTQTKSSAKRPRKKRAPRVFGPEKARALFSALAEDRPDPRTELDFVNPYTLVVAVALSAQATDVGVNKATAKLFALADTPEKMLALGEAGVAEHIKTIGLWRNKAKNVIALSQMLLDELPKMWEMQNDTFHMTSRKLIQIDVQQRHTFRW